MRLISTRSLLLGIAGLVATTVMTPSTHAQSGMGAAFSKNITVGPMFTAGASVSAGDVAQGWKTDYRFAWSGGALGFLPISEAISFGLGLVYDSRGMNFHHENDENVGYDTRFNYFSIRPLFRFSDFYIGAGIGLPLSATATDVKTGISGSVNDSLNTLFEVRIGGAIQLMRIDAGELRLIVDGAYPFTKLVGSESKNNGPVATAQIGLAWLFDTHSAQ